MVHQRVHKSSSYNSQPQEKSAQSSPRFVSSPAAKPDTVATQSLERLSQFHHNFSNIPVYSPDQQPTQAKLQADMSGNRQDSSRPQISNPTRLPDQLKTGIENISGYSMDPVRVHYNSDKPAQLQAHAYTQGLDIHVASGQEKYLPHEAWHVVQQMQGRVQPVMTLKRNVLVNDETSLETEADVMGAKAVQLQNSQPEALQQFQYRPLLTVQRVQISNEKTSDYLLASKMGDDRYYEKFDIIKGLGDANFGTIDDLKIRVSNLLPEKGVFLDGKAVNIIGVGSRYYEHIELNKSVNYIRKYLREIKVGKDQSIKIGEGRTTGYETHGQILYNYDGSTIEIYHAHDKGKMG